MHFLTNQCENWSFLHLSFNEYIRFKDIQANIVFLVVHFLTYHLTIWCKYWSFYTHYLIKSSGFRGIQANIVLLLVHF